MGVSENYCSVLGSLSSSVRNPSIWVHIKSLSFGKFSSHISL